MHVRNMHPSIRPCIYDVFHTSAAGRERRQLKADGFFIKWFGGEKRTAPNGNLTAFTRVFSSTISSSGIHDLRLLGVTVWTESGAIGA